MLVKIDYYPIDCVTAEDHEMEAEATEFPVEEGSTTTDHVILRPRGVTIKGIVSDTPIGAIREFRGGSNLSPTEEALVQLEGLYESKDPVTVETTLKTYERMVLVKLSIPRDANTGHALTFAATFRQITISEVRRVVVRAVTIAKKKKSLGLLNGQPPNWIADDSKGRKIFATEIAPGNTVYTREDGTRISSEEAAAAARRGGVALTEKGADGVYRPVSQKDVVPYTPKQRKPAWVPNVPGIGR